MAKPLQVTYSRTVSDGNYGNRKIEVVMEVEEGETEQEALDAARTFVALNLQDCTPEPEPINYGKLPWE